jgi:hypothetical protein
MEEKIKKIIEILKGSTITEAEEILKKARWSLSDITIV